MARYFNQRKLNGRPDRPKLGDPLWADKYSTRGQNASAVKDFRKNGWAPPIRDQGNEGDCTGFSTTQALGVLSLKKDPRFTGYPFSAQFAYYNGRLAEGDQGQDSGAQLRDVVSGAVSQGVAQESVWPESEPFAVMPSEPAYQNASHHKVGRVLRLDNTKITQLKGCINNGHPFVFGATVYDTIFNVGSDGVVPMPTAFGNVAGGHALCCVGYDDVAQIFIVANSWGSGYGDGGYCYFPYAYLTNGDLVSDAWAIES